MKLTYDPRYNVAYICLKEKTEQVETLQISDDLPIDIAPDGSVYGFELLNARQQLHADNGGKLTIINEEHGNTTEIALTP
ncbi:MAG: DUF2283 domain-containing protein [Deltaproteobacteria bacterium]|nr:DUF2283 domain-containing protein [Deltaproteobacteria bacterium]